MKIGFVISNEDRKIKQKPLKRTHFYWSDKLFLLCKVSPIRRNVQVQTELEISDGPLQHRRYQLLRLVDALRQKPRASQAPIAENQGV